MNRFIARLMAAAALAMPLTVASTVHANPITKLTKSADAQPLTGRKVFERALSSTCWVTNSYGRGTGWVLDREKRLIVTNDHVVQTVDVSEVFFPIKENGRLLREPDYYLKNVKPIKAKVIDRDPVLDLAVLQLESMPDTAKEVKLASESAQDGDILRAVGGLPDGSAGLWGHISGEVRAVVRRTNSRGFLIQMIESTMPINRGNSGGAVLNEFGELAGVVQSAHFGGQIHNTSMLIDISEVHNFLKASLPLIEPKTGLEWATRGVRKARAARVDAALADFEAALKVDPKTTLALGQRGIIRRNQGKLQDAINDFTKAIEIDAKDASLFTARGVTYRILKKNAEAIADGEVAVKLNPKDVQAVNELGLSYFVNSEFGKAAERFANAAELSKKDAVIWSNLGIAHRLAGKHAEAIKAYNEAIAIAPEGYAGYNPTPTYFGRGISRRELKQHGPALGDFTKTIQLNGKDALAWFERGLTHKAMGNNDLAEVDFKEAIKLDAKTFTPKVAALKTTTPKQPAKLEGDWSFNGKVKGKTLLVSLKLNDDGTYEHVQKFNNADGTPRTVTSTGTFEIKDKVLNLTTSKKVKIARKLELAGDKVAIEYSEIGQTLNFERVK